MGLRLRKLVGSVALILFLIAYSIAGMMVAIAVLPTGGKLVELAFYVIAGLAWVVPAGWLVHWMYRQ